MNNKVSVTWGSGDLKSSFEVYLGTGKSKKAANLFSSKVTGLILYSWMMTIQYLLYIGVLLACIYLFNSKSKIALLCMIYITGYFTFLHFGRLVLDMQWEFCSSNFIDWCITRKIFS
ncbi:hypothetical protein [Enterococcus durans]|uniref:hypothetical protein n=1 Tax=Enterococcus durans TaxID=53345 RepID=UPI001D0ED9BC|nr:hypothetical protein [Enterococcus durans]